MPRPPATVTKTASWWDADESVTFRTTIPLLDQQAIRMHTAQREQLMPLDSLEKIAQHTESLAQDCLVWIADWTLRDRTLVYEEAQARGESRPRLSLSVESIVGYLDEQDMIYLLVRGNMPQLAVPVEERAADATFPPGSDESAPADRADPAPVQAPLRRRSA